MVCCCDCGRIIMMPFAFTDKNPLQIHLEVAAKLQPIAIRISSYRQVRPLVHFWQFKHNISHSLAKVFFFLLLFFFTSTTSKSLKVYCILLLLLRNVLLWCGKHFKGAGFKCHWQKLDYWHDLFNYNPKQPMLTACVYVAIILKKKKKISIATKSAELADCWCIHYDEAHFSQNISHVIYSWNKKFDYITYALLWGLFLYTMYNIIKVTLKALEY